MKTFAIAALAMVATGCVAQAQNPITFDNTIKPTLAKYYACGDRFYEKYRASGKDISLLSAALGQFCAGEERELRYVAVNFYLAQGVTDASKAYSVADKVIAERRATVIGRIAQFRL